MSYCRRQLKVGLCLLSKYITAIYARAASPIQVSVYARTAVLAVNARTVSYLSVLLPEAVYVRAASPIQVSVYARAASPIKVSVYARAASPIQEWLLMLGLCLLLSKCLTAKGSLCQGCIAYPSVSLRQGCIAYPSVSLRQGCIAFPRVWLLMLGLCLLPKCYCQRKFMPGLHRIFKCLRQG